jgi:mono/diheme cytochrome c family protein
LATTADDGRSLYVQNCASCHGDDGRGGGPDADLFPAPPRDLLSGFLAKYDDETLLRRIREGRTLPLYLDDDALRAHSRQVDALVAHLKRLPGIDWNVVEPGWAAWVDRCEVCHGPTGDGPGEIQTDTPPADLSSPAVRERNRGAALIDAVRHQRGGMPALNPALSEDEARLIASFVDLFSPGFSVYSRFCANCHADDGRGAGTLGEVPGDILPLPAFAFDKAWFATRSDEQIRAKVWHMLETNKPSMPHFRVMLTGDETRAILRYLRTLGPAPKKANSN